MCGWVGVSGPPHVDVRKLEELIFEMSSALHHRGPDDSGVWADSAAGVGLGHRRLSIIDLSPQGHQPMVSATGRYVIAYNGEIYNYRILRSELEALGEAPNWKGHSDTEVLLAALDCWGLESTLRKLNGMFSFALWDKYRRVLHLARDRFGEKPLYYGWLGDIFLCGSELKAFKQHPAWGADVDRAALALFMRHNYIPAPYCIYKGFYKLLPGHFLTYRCSGPRRDDTQSVPYWSAKEMVDAGIDRNSSEPKIIVQQLDDLLRDAVKLRMEADVPLGAFLSGGYDSSTIVSLMQSQSSSPIKTFSIGFEEKQYNEAPYAKAVAKFLKTEHTELYVTAEEAMAVIPQLPSIYDEPFSDSSQIPTYLISALTRNHVTVALSGDGGDELFGGYERYLWGRKIWQRLRLLPRAARTFLSKGLSSVSPEKWDRYFAVLSSSLPGFRQISLPGDKIHKLADVLSCRTGDEMYHRLVSHWTPGSVVLGANEPPTALTQSGQWPSNLNFTEKMMFLDTLSYLPNDILTKVDRASMAVSLEARIPMLDPRVAKFAWSIPHHLKIRSGTGKWVLRQVLYKYIPRRLMERPKMGFGVPIDTWLRGSLRDWAESLLNESRINQEGFLDSAPIRKKWNEHLSGRRNWAYYLWDVLMFESWLNSEQRTVDVRTRGESSSNEWAVN